MSKMSCEDATSGSDATYGNPMRSKSTKTNALVDAAFYRDAKISV